MARSARTVSKIRFNFCGWVTRFHVEREYNLEDDTEKPVTLVIETPHETIKLDMSKAQFEACEAALNDATTYHQPQLESGYSFCAGRYGDK